MSNKSQYAKAFTALLALTLFATGCAKKRDAALPEEAQENIFAISEIPELQTENTQFKVQTDDSLSTLSLGDSSKATAEKGSVSVRDANVPNRLKYMFKGLEMSGQAGHSYPVTFSVDKQFVTAYKIVSDTSELSALEKHLSQVKEEVLLHKQLQKSKDAKKAKSLVESLKKIRNEKQAMLSQKSAPVLVPLFKYKIAGYGVLQRVKNQLNEETSTLRLKTTDWADATHIQLSINPADRMHVGIDASSRGDLDRTFVMNKINNKVMTAGTLNTDYQIPVNLEKDVRVLTLLDVDALHVFEVGQIGKTVLTDSQLAQLNSGAKNANVRKCSEDLVKALPAEAQANCILVLRYDVPVTYVKPELAAVDYEGNQDATVQFKPVRAGDNVGLVQIAQNVEAKKVEANTQFDPRTTIKIADIKGKEFFYRRTLEDVPFSVASPGLAAGMAGSIAIVKFELEEKRLVVRKADQIANYKSGTNALDYEELMSIPVKYLKLEEKDATGAKYAMARLVEASRKDADYIELDWTNNTLPQDKSPYAAIWEGCLTGVADSQVSDVDMRLENGVLSFSQLYSVGLRWGCIGDFMAYDDYNGTAGYQASARIKERVSFKVNDGSSDKSFVANLPFSAQNALGYGVWTIGQANPDQNNLRGREGTEKHFQMVHDFRNGKKLVYTVTGLPTDDAEMRKLYIEATEELVKAWNFAYKQAFKGTALEREGNYLEMQIAGENGVTGHLGDLDKNIIHFENKPADHGILGVSQVGFNPRSAIVVADSLILYAGNMKQDVGSQYRNMKIKQNWDKMKEDFRDQARKQLEEQMKAEAEAAAKAPAAQGAQDKAAVATQFTRNLVKSLKAPEASASDLGKAKNLAAAMRSLKSAVAERKSLGGDSSFKFSAPQTQDAWMHKVHRALREKPDMSPREIETVMAREMLASKGAKLSAKERASLAKVVKTGEIRTKMMAAMQTTPGCMKTMAETANANFVNLPFNQALKIEIINTLGHEIGHSQGLTHNFVGSFDKKNFANEDGTPSKRNYSSIMDYLAAGKFNWDGLGTYDIRALRASHLGLFEVTPEFKAKLESNANFKKLLVNGKYISIDTIKASFAKNGWANFTKNNVKDVLKDFMYCTDKDVGYEPTCERHDFGTSATEIVESAIADWEQLYVTSFHAWDRLVFDVRTSINVSSYSSYYQFRMRKFMDELFYMLVLQTGTQEEVGDYFNAALKTYLFYTQMINTPDAQSYFQSQDRFIAVPYEKKEVNEKGEPTGKVSVDVAIVEKRAIQDIASTKDRLDTVGLEYEKITAMDMLTMKGYPSYKYYSQSIIFSFLDFEKYLLQMSAENSLFVNTITGMMLDQLTPTFTNEDVMLQPISGEKATVTPSMRFYAGIYGILNLEASTLRDKDNFATLFKVGSSVGQTPADRVSLSQLGVSNQSKTRVSFWALDNALAANNLINVAAQKNFFLQNAETLTPIMEELVGNQLKNMIAGGAQEAAVKASQDKLVAKLKELNKDGAIISAEAAAQNPKLTIEALAANIVQLNQQVISVSIGILTEQKGADEVAQQLAQQAAELAEAVPLFAIAQNAINSGLEKTGKELAAGNKELEVLAGLSEISSQLVNGSSLEVSYGIIMKNLEFLNKLTIMTNPEYNR